MKITLGYLRLNAQGTWHREVEEHLQRRRGLMPISPADVVLARPREGKPPFRVQVRPETGRSQGFERRA